MVDPTQPNPCVNPTHGQVWSRLEIRVSEELRRRRDAGSDTTIVKKIHVS